MKVYVLVNKNFSMVHSESYNEIVAIHHIQANAERNQSELNDQGELIAVLVIETED